jgi:iron complex transport system permease protein
MKKQPLFHFMVIIILVLFITMGITAACALGKVPIRFADVIFTLIKRIPLIGDSLVQFDCSQFVIKSVLFIRLPRAILAVLVGAGLACSGAAFQGLFKNPLADPYFVGVSAGAALGGSLALVAGVTIFMGVSGVGLSAFFSALITIFVVYRLAYMGGKAATFHLVLAGIAVSAFLTACVSLVMALHTGKIREIITWTMGSFEYSTWDEVALFSAAFGIGLGGMLLFSRDLNVLLTGEETAHTLGVPVEKIKLILLILASLVGAMAVAVSGIIWFVGLIIPHAVRLLFGSDHKLLFPYSALFGGVFLLAADVASRLILTGSELPVGVITALCGAPFFLYLLMKSKKEFYR